MPESHQTLNRRTSHKWVKTGALGLLLSMVCGGVLINLSQEDFSLVELTRISPGALLLLAAMVTIAWICNGLRTWMLSKVVGHPIPIHRAVGITLSMEFAIACTPGGIGGVITRMSLQKRLGMPYKKSTSLMAADWLADWIFFAALAPIGLYQLWQWLPTGTVSFEGPRANWIWVLPILLTAVAAVFVFRRPIANLLPPFRRSMLQKWRKDLLSRLKQHAKETRQCLALIRSRYRWQYCLVLLFAVLQWTCRYGILVVVLWALKHEVQPILLMLIQGSLFFLGLVVVMPGGGGTVELITSFALTPMVGMQTAVLAVVVWRFFTYYLYLAGGGLAFALVTRHWWNPLRADRPGEAIPADPPSTRSRSR